MHKNQHGFHAVAVVLIVAVLSVIGFAGWKVMQARHEEYITADDTPTTAVAKLEPKKAADTEETKTYTNDEYGFSFEYPKGWDLVEDLKNIGRGQNEGSVTVISPKGTKVHFNPNLGGKGGDCADENNQYTTKNCSTQDIILVEKLPSSSDAKPVYFYHMSLTAPDNSGGKTEFFQTIMSGEYRPATTGKTVGAFISPYDEISGTKVGYLTVYVEGKDDTLNDSAKYFEGTNAKESEPVLKSFKFL